MRRSRTLSSTTCSRCSSLASATSSKPTRARCSSSTRLPTSWSREPRLGSRRRSSAAFASRSAAVSPAAIAAERRPVILDDVDHADVLNPILREKGIKSMLGVPLLVAGEALGVIHVGTLVHRRFTTDDVELLKLVADRVALAIERARLHEQTVQLDELKANFVAIASHELRTPATSVYGVLTTLLERDEQLDDGPAQRAVAGRRRAGRAPAATARGAARPVAPRRTWGQRQAEAARAGERPGRDRLRSAVDRRDRRARRSRRSRCRRRPPRARSRCLQPADQRSALRRRADHAVGEGGRRRSSGSRSRTAARALPRSCAPACSNASHAPIRRTSAAGSALRSPAPTPVRTAETSSTTRARAARASA